MGSWPIGKYPFVLSQHIQDHHAQSGRFKD
jgi:hypothetical protein